MNTNTVNPQSAQSDRTEPPGSGPESGKPLTSAPALRRPLAGRMLAGVAEGLARYLGVDTAIVRIAFVILAVVGGAGIPLYLAGLLLIPDEASGQSIAGSVLESLQSR